MDTSIQVSETISIFLLFGSLLLLHSHEVVSFATLRYILLVCELDLVFSLHKSLLILFEMFIGGMLCESNKREVLKAIVEAEELVEEMTKPGEDTASQLDDGLSFQEQFQLGRKPGRRTGAGAGR
jgi:AP-1 complex subunit sigma 1/2